MEKYGMERSMLGIWLRDKMKNHWIWQQTKVVEVMERIASHFILTYPNKMKASRTDRHLNRRAKAVYVASLNFEQKTKSTWGIFAWQLQW